VALEAVINQLPVPADDPDFGEVPQPAPQIADACRTGPVRRPPVP
jgi:hypothetical protein